MLVETKVSRIMNIFGGVYDFGVIYGFGATHGLSLGGWGCMWFHSNLHVSTMEQYKCICTLNPVYVQFMNDKGHGDDIYYCSGHSLNRIKYMNICINNG